MNKILKNTLIMTAITLVAGLGLGLVYEITKAPIAQAQETAKKKAWQEGVPEADINDFAQVEVDEAAADQALADMGVNGTVDEACTVGDMGYVVTAADKDGFGGSIQVTVGITSDGTVNGVSILSINETAGLGMKAAESSFYGQYEGKQTEKFVVSKDGGDGEPIDALSGATITSRSVTGAVNAALGYYQAAFQ